MTIGPRNHNLINLIYLFFKLETDRVIDIDLDVGEITVEQESYIGERFRTKLDDIVWSYSQSNIWQFLAEVNGYNFTDSIRIKLRDIIERELLI